MFGCGVYPIWDRTYTIQILKVEIERGEKYSKSWTLYLFRGSPGIWSCMNCLIGLKIEAEVLHAVPFKCQNMGFQTN